jgi:hypothetical protein
MAFCPECGQAVKAGEAPSSVVMPKEAAVERPVEIHAGIPSRARFVHHMGWLVWGLVFVAFLGGVFSLRYYYDRYYKPGEIVSHQLGTTEKEYVQKWLAKASEQVQRPLTPGETQEVTKRAKKVWAGLLERVRVKPVDADINVYLLDAMNNLEWFYKLSGSSWVDQSATERFDPNYRVKEAARKGICQKWFELSGGGNDGSMYDFDSHMPRWKVVKLNDGWWRVSGEYSYTLHVPFPYEHDTYRVINFSIEVYDEGNGWAMREYSSDGI